MNINLKQAVKYFFSNPSLELVFIEAVNNSIDAEATLININISIDSIDKPESLEIEINDNGVGLNDLRFAKFAKLLEVEDSSHKGIGRLVFLSYFNEVEVVSNFDSNKKRNFIYNNEFNIDNDRPVTISNNVKSSTSLKFKKYYLKKIAKAEFLSPVNLKKRLLEEFYPKFYLMKNDNKILEIVINLKLKETSINLPNITESAKINVSEIQTLKEEPIEMSSLAMFENMSINYSIKKSDVKTTLITALCIDGRTYNLDIIDIENLPFGYEIIFLLFSGFFEGKVNPSRQELTLSDAELKNIKLLFQRKISEILKKEIITIVESNQKMEKSLIQNYPHLIGYFEQETIGFIKRDSTIKKAQDRFFKEQREVLDGNILTEEVYNKTIELSARALTEYILYRQKIIEKMKLLDKDNSEADIHNLLLPKGNVILGKNLLQDLYSNNAWILDDKYMSYNTILSDKSMSNLISAITDEEVKGINGDPDLAMIFSNDPNGTNKVDVVIVELKKRGIKLADNVTALTQLLTRARKLLKYYPNKIQRIWFYAVVEFSEELTDHLRTDSFSMLFSTDTMYYKEYPIYDSGSSNNAIPVGVFMISLDAIIGDADSRNSTFLNLLKDGFIKQMELAKK